MPIHQNMLLGVSHTKTSRNTIGLEKHFNPEADIDTRWRWVYKASGAAASQTTCASVSVTTQARARQQKQKQKMAGDKEHGGSKDMIE